MSNRNDFEGSRMAWFIVRLFSHELEWGENYNWLIFSHALVIIYILRSSSSSASLAIYSHTISLDICRIKLAISGHLYSCIFTARAEFLIIPLYPRIKCKLSWIWYETRTQIQKENLSDYTKTRFRFSTIIAIYYIKFYAANESY
jgi:hypothetical protein